MCLNKYYRAQRKACTSFYQNLSKKSRYGINGFLNNPFKVYNYFVPIICNPGPILDIGCGNGHLLSHLLNNCNYKIIPYGVDFHTAAIVEAKNTILPLYRYNFNCSDALNWHFDVSFSYIFVDPIIVHDNDRLDLIALAENHLKPKGKLILYTYPDGLNKLNISSLCCFPGISTERCQKLVFNPQIEIQEYRNS